MKLSIHRLILAMPRFLVLLLWLIIKGRANSNQAISLSGQVPTMFRSQLLSYVSFNTLPNSVLNASVLQDIKLSCAFQCMLQCIRSPGCQSANFREDMQKCGLLELNRHSNASLLIRDSHWSHLSIKSPCDVWPCKNGGVCQPEYSSGSFRCNCPPGNTTYIVTGDRCEDVQVGINAASLYTRFDLANGKLSVKGHVTTSPSNGGKYEAWDPSVARLVTSAERNSTVFYMAGAKMTGLRISLTGFAKCTSDTAGCQGNSLTAWIKLPCIGDKELITFATSGVFNEGGLYLGYRGKRRFICVLTRTDLNFQVEELILKASNDLQWLHFGCVFNANEERKVLLYINGRLVKTNSSVKSAIQSYSPTGWLSIGHTPSDNIGKGYIDDVALWDVPLTEEDIMTVYKG